MYKLLADYSKVFVVTFLIRLLHGCWNERVSYNLNGYSKCVEKLCSTRSDGTTSVPRLRTRRRFICFPPASLLPPPGYNRREKSADFDRGTYHRALRAANVGDQREITTGTIGR